MSLAAGQSATAFHHRQQERQYRDSDIPPEMALITVAGTVQCKSTVLLTTDPHTSDAFGTMFDGDLQPKRKATHLAEWRHSIPQRAAERDARNVRLHPTFVSSEPSMPFATSTAIRIPYDGTEKGARMSVIVNFWRGLASQHRHSETHLQLVEGNCSTTVAPDA
nr:unnamed protein product [Leishmania braziliensis]